jgi:hypothetical protein
MLKGGGIRWSEFKKKKKFNRKVNVCNFFFFKLHNIISSHIFF